MFCLFSRFLKETPQKPPLSSLHHHLSSPQPEHTNAFLAKCVCHHLSTKVTSPTLPQVYNLYILEMILAPWLSHLLQHNLQPQPLNHFTIPKPLVMPLRSLNVVPGTHPAGWRNTRVLYHKGSQPSLTSSRPSSPTFFHLLLPLPNPHQPTNSGTPFRYNYRYWRQPGPTNHLSELT